jgi:(p)ppGpp synthase/HD superfamily hydrolase
MVEGAKLVQRAASIARRAHDGQVDKSGNPYLGHLERVAGRASVSGEDAEVVAWLHDVVEDTEVTLDMLRDEGVPDHIITAVDAMTKRPGEDREAYLQRVKANPLALIVKAADVADNTAPERLQLLDESTRRRLEEKYAHTRTVLGL